MNSSGPPWPAAITIRSWNGLFHQVFLPFCGCGLVAGFLVQVSVIASYTVAALGGIPLLYRACRHGVRFADSGITVRNFYRTHKLSWHDVSRLNDGKVYTFGAGGTYFWAVQIVPNSERSVTAEGTMRAKESNVSRMLTTMERVAARWQIPAQLTG